MKMLSFILAMSAILAAPTLANDWYDIVLPVIEHESLYSLGPEEFLAARYWVPTCFSVYNDFYTDDEFIIIVNERESITLVYNGCTPDVVLTISEICNDYIVLTYGCTYTFYLHLYPVGSYILAYFYSETQSFYVILLNAELHRFSCNSYVLDHIFGFSSVLGIEYTYCFDYPYLVSLLDLYIKTDVYVDVKKTLELPPIGRPFYPYYPPDEGEDCDC